MKIIKEEEEILIKERVNLIQNQKKKLVKISPLSINEVMK